MKYNRFSEDELKKHLKGMPDIKDRQSKEALYAKVAPHVNAQKPLKKTGKVLPAIALIAVLLLIAIITPAMFMNRPTDEGMEGSYESSHNPDTAPDIVNENNGEESTEITGESYEGTGKLDSGLRSHLVLDDAAADQHLIHLGVAGMNAEQIIPLTMQAPLTEGDLSKQWQRLSSISPQLEIWGLGSYPLEGADLNIKGDVGEAVFPDDFKANGGSSFDVLLEKSILATFRPYEVKSVRLSHEDGSPFEMGHFGEVDEIMIDSTPKESYKVYQYSDDSPFFLVPIAMDKEASIDEALHAMNFSEGGMYIRSSIPEGVELAVEGEEGRLLQVHVLKDKPLKDNQQTLTMIEAVLATAKSFGYEKVDFQGLSMETIGSYDLTETVAVPVAINPVTYEELLSP